MRDARSRTEALAQIDRATAVCDELRAKLDRRSETLGPVGEDLRGIIADLPAAEGNGRQLAELERRFKECSKKLLAVTDS